jgi:hypothetical protein
VLPVQGKFFEPLGFVPDDDGESRCCFWFDAPHTVVPALISLLWLCLGFADFADELKKHESDAAFNELSKELKKVSTCEACARDKKRTRSTLLTSLVTPFHSVTDHEGKRHAPPR